MDERTKYEKSDNNRIMKSKGTDTYFRQTGNPQTHGQTGRQQ